MSSPPITPASQPASTTVLGMLYMIAGTFLLTLQDGITKWLTTDFHAGEIMFYRGLWMFPALAVLIHFNGGPRTLRLQQPAGVVWRGVAALGASILVTLSFKKMPLAEASALVFLSPLLLTAVSPWLLRESVGWQRWAAVAFGFVGVLVMVQPGTDAFDIWVLFPLAASVFSAARDLMTRRFCARDTATAVMFYTSLVACLAGAATLPFGTHWPSLAQWGLFMAGGTILSFAHVLIVRAFQLAPGAPVSAMKYLSLVWAAIIGFMVWGDVPGPMKLLGAALVVAAGMFILYRETKR